MSDIIQLLTVIATDIFHPLSHLIIPFTYIFICGHFHIYEALYFKAKQE